MSSAAFPAVSGRDYRTVKPTTSEPGGPAAARRQNLSPRRRREKRARIYRRLAFVASLLLALAWTLFSIWVSTPWRTDLGALTHPLLALFVLTFIAYVPGFMNAFVTGSLLLEHRRPRPPLAVYPGVTVLIAAFQEEAAIAETLRSIAAVAYPGPLEIIVLDDGSTDATADMVEICRPLFAGATGQGGGPAPGDSLRLACFATNRGKAAVLNDGLASARHDLIVTIDADTRLEPGSLSALVERLHADPPGTAAVAGAVLVGNPHDSLVAGAQQWDYFHGIAAVKRMQSMYDGTLVAQGAFSIYRRAALVAAGGWPDTVGEDIVLTWGLLQAGHRVGYAEDAIAWTHAPETFGALARQRKRWARGMIEALDHHKALLFRPRLGTMFIWWNLLFISLDAAFTFFFLPGLVLVLFGIFWLAGPITLLVLPLAALWNLLIYRIQKRMLDRAGATLDPNRFGFLFYMFVYPLLMQPVSVWGYASELGGRTKQWGGT
jgi:biofilm PGA synthesis N-glycosyltransferase PgaC